MKWVEIESIVNNRLRAPAHAERAAGGLPSGDGATERVRGLLSGRRGQRAAGGERAGPLARGAHIRRVLSAVGVWAALRERRALRVRRVAGARLPLRVPAGLPWRALRAGAGVPAQRVLRDVRGAGHRVPERARRAAPVV